MNFWDTLKSYWNEHIISHLSTRTALLIVMACCLVSLLFQYFGREDAVSPVTLAGAVVVPFQTGVNAIGGFLFDTEQERLSLNEAQERAERLKEENDLLKLRLQREEALVKENEELRSLLRAKERLKEYEVMEGTVIGNDGTRHFERFTIDRGSLDGVKVNMNVINGDGLIGYISSVGLNYAVVTCITEDGVSVSAMTRNGHENCIVTGSLELSETGGLVLDNALSDIDFAADSTLVTSSISDRYLPNLLIGYVDHTEAKSGNLTQSGTVRCAVDFTKIREVLIITTMKEEKEG